MRTAYRTFFTPVLCVLLIGLADNSGARAAESDKESRPLQERCIFLPRVRNVEIVDDKTLIWHMSGGPHKAYKMTLSFRCSSLSFRESFVHSSSTSQLCDIGEWIRVIASHQTCPIERIEPWTPPEKDKAGGGTKKKDGGDIPRSEPD